MHPLFSLTVGGLLLFGFLSGSSFLPGQTRWKGYYLVLLEQDADPDKTIRDLRTAGFDSVLSFRTATVRIHGFPNMETVELSRLKKRLQPEDPRFDGFLSKVERIFQPNPSGGELLYLPASQHPMLFHLRLSSILSGKKWMMVDWDLLESLILLLLFVIFVVFQVARFQIHRGMRTVVAIAWIPIILQGTLIRFIFAVWCYQELTRFLDSLLFEVEQSLYNQTREGIREALSDMLRTFLLPVAILSIMGEGHLLLSVLFGSFLTLVAGFEIVLLRIFRLKQRVHRIFLPLPILPTHWKKPRRSILPGSIALVLSILPLVFLLLVHDLQIQVPTPGERVGHFLFGTRASLKDLWVFHKDDPLPNLGDFIVHLKYQTGFPFGATYDFPSNDEKLLYPRFREEGGKLTYWVETMEMYDQTWYKRTLQITRKDGLGNLFYQQGARVVVWEPVPRRPSGIQLVLYYLMVFWLVAAYYGIDLPLVRRPAHRLLGLRTRRRQQEA
ncbi:MAG: hypothetical protein Kow009_02930 [Spirochaetales bacterium]